MKHYFNILTYIRKKKYFRKKLTYNQYNFSKKKDFTLAKKATLSS